MDEILDVGAVEETVPVAKMIIPVPEAVVEPSEDAAAV